MRFVALDPEPILVASGVLTPLGTGVEFMARKGRSAGANRDGSAMPPIAEKTNSPLIRDPGLATSLSGGSHSTLSRESIAGRGAKDFDSDRETEAPRGATVPGDLAALCGEAPLKLRRMDRYGALGFTAARLAMRGAPRGPEGKGDPDWGVLVGSSQACWCSTAAYFLDLCARAPIDLSPAVFARSVSNTVNGEVSIAHSIGGISETFISGWESGAEAIAAACAALAEGRARWILAGGVEAPEPALTKLHEARAREVSMAWLPATLCEGAGFCLLTSEAAAADPASPVVLAYARAFDPQYRWSLAGAVDALWPTRIGAVIVANTVPPDLLVRWKNEAGDAFVIVLPELTGEIGAAGGAVAMALAAAALSTGGLGTFGMRPGAWPPTAPPAPQPLTMTNGTVPAVGRPVTKVAPTGTADRVDPSTASETVPDKTQDCVLVIARGAEGGTVVVALGRGGSWRRS